jgi:hypothetical protein
MIDPRMITAQRIGIEKGTEKERLREKRTATA